MSDLDCGVNDRILYAAALACCVVLVAAAYLAVRLWKLRSH